MGLPGSPGVRIEGASGRVSPRLLPVEKRRSGGMVLFKSQLGTRWVMSGNAERLLRNEELADWEEDVRPSGYITIAAMRETAERYESDLPEASWFLKYTGCERYCRPFYGTNINLHKIFKNNNRSMNFSGIVYLYLDFTFSG